mgnify:CR=1 FL=1
MQGVERYEIIRQINNNAALALDGNGKELVVLGRGVGFPQMPYELTDLSRIERTFYDVNPNILAWRPICPPAGAGLRRDHGAG